MNAYEFDGYCRDIAKRIEERKSRPRTPVALLLVEFYRTRAGKMRAIVDGRYHDRREEISIETFISRSNTNDEYYKALSELMLLAEEKCLSVLDYIYQGFGEKCRKWDIVIRYGQPVKIDDIELAWELME